MQTGLESKPEPVIKMIILSLKEGIEKFLSDPTDKKIVMAHLSFTLLQTAEAELLKRGFDPNDKRYGHDLSDEILSQDA